MLVVLKVIVGLMIGSVSVLSEAIHSGIDLIAAGIALFAVKTAGKPADRDHPFGHGKFENISGTVEALLIFLAAGWIVYEAVHKLRHPAPLDAASWGVAVMLFSATVNIVISRFLFKVGHATNSVALVADAWHLRTDVWTSIGVTAGLALIWLSGRVWPGLTLYWLDPVAALLVAALILHAAYRLTVQAGRDLLDTGLPFDEEQWIRECITTFSPDIFGYHQLRTRRAGAFRFVEFHLQVTPTMSVKVSHDLAEDLKARIKAHFDQVEVLIHVEPCDKSCPPKCLEGCLLTEAERLSNAECGFRNAE
jgi:cation diffusion facilitator family transporter